MKMDQGKNYKMMAKQLAQAREENKVGSASE